MTCDMPTSGVSGRNIGAIEGRDGSLCRLELCCCLFGTVSVENGLETVIYSLADVAKGLLFCNNCSLRMGSQDVKSRSHSSYRHGVGHARAAYTRGMRMLLDACAGARDEVAVKYQAMCTRTRCTPGYQMHSVLWLGLPPRR